MQLYVLCACMLDNIVERFLGDPKQRFLRRRGLRHIAVEVEADAQAVALDTGRVALDGGDQPIPP